MYFVRRGQWRMQKQYQPRIPYSKWVEYQCFVGAIPEIHASCNKKIPVNAHAQKTFFLKNNPLKSNLSGLLVLSKFY